MNLPPRLVRVWPGLRHMDIKNCRACGLDKPAADFTRARRICKACRAQYEQAWRDRHPERCRELDWIKRRQSGPQRKARHAVWTALKAGRISKSPCEDCGHPKVEAHHADYARPLEVNWLCRKHHNARHPKSAAA